MYDQGMSDNDGGGCLLSCAGCGAMLTPDEANELAAVLAANDTFHKDMMEGAVPQAVMNSLRTAVTFHALHTCERCGPFQRVRVTYLGGTPRAAA
jgi:hypothetical protein